MRQVWLGLLLVPLAGYGQVTLRLRYGGPASVYHVSAVSSGTPAVLTVWRHTDRAQVHDLADGDTVYIQFVPGCQSANGYRKVVNANRTAGTFGITDLAGQNITCNYPFESKWESGFAGKVQPYTLRETRPRILLPGSGPILERSKDPDGSGPQVAPVAEENGPAWQNLVNYFTSNGWITSGCDGATPELCPNEEAHLGNSHTLLGWAPFAAAYVWYADNGKTGHLNLARYYLNHAHRTMLQNTSNIWFGWGFPCDNSTQSCGFGSGADWVGISMFNYAMAYDLIRDQLTAAERAAFAAKMLNGFEGGGCANQLEKQAGSANLTQGSKTVTGTGFSVYGAGDGVYFKTGEWGTTGRWGYVVSVASDTEMTVNFVSGSSKTAASPVSYSGADHYRVAPWDQTRCGAGYIVGSTGYGYYVGTAVPQGATNLSAAIGAGDTEITVDSVANFLDQPPFYVLIDNEVLRVTGINGSTLTVERGQLYSTAKAHNAGVAVIWTRQPRGTTHPTASAFAFAGEWGHNLTAQQLVARLIAAFALAGDDERAAGYAERMWNYYYDLLYPLNKEYWSGPTQGGTQNKGYQYGRWQATHLQAGLAGRHAFESGQIDILEPYFWRGLVTAFLWTPPAKPDGSANWSQMPIDPGITDYYTQSSLGWTAAAAMLNPGTPETAYARYWYRNLSGLWNTTSITNQVYVAAFSPLSAAEADFRSVVNPWSFHKETDFNGDTYFGLLVSKSDWSPSATMLLAGLGWSYPFDHTVDQGVAVPGCYAIFKGSKVLLGRDVNYGFGGGSGTTNWFEIGGSSGSLKSVNYVPWYSGVAGGQQNRMDRTHGDGSYVYARGDSTLSFRAEYKVVRAHRHVAHLKGSPEYVVVFDDVVTSAANQKRTRLFYHKSYDAASSFSADETLTSVTFRKPTGQAASLLTKVLFPDGSNPTRSRTTTTNSEGIIYDWGSVTAAQMIAVHRVSGGTSDTMPAISVLSADAASYAIQIGDPTSPTVIVLPRTGTDAQQRSWTASASGTGTVLVTGLAAGTYDVYRNGQRLVDDAHVSADDGTLALQATAVAGDWIVSAIPPVELAVDRTALYFEAAGQNPASQQLIAQCTGGSCTISATPSTSWLSVVPSKADDRLEATVTVNAAGMPIGIYHATITISAPGVIGSPKTVEVQLAVTQQLRGGSRSQSLKLRGGAKVR